MPIDAVGSTPKLDLSRVHEGMPVKAPKVPAADNSVGGHDTTHQSGGGSPTLGAREAATQRHNEIEQMTEERLASNPEYQDLKTKFDTWKDVEADFALIDGNTLGKNDGKIDLAALQALSGDENANQAARDAANRLLNNRAIWNELASGLDGHNDNLVGIDDVRRFVAGMKAGLKEMRSSARAEVTAELGPAPNAQPATSTAATGAAAATAGPGSDPKAIMVEAGNALPKPAPSQFSGLEGASENLNNMVGWAEAETDRLTTLMGKTDDPAVLKQLETKINQMSRRMQQMTALMNQVMTAMQNISKMYSDIAMNSVRNMK